MQRVTLGKLRNGIFKALAALVSALKPHIFDHKSLSALCRGHIASLNALNTWCNQVQRSGWRDNLVTRAISGWDGCSVPRGPGSGLAVLRTAGQTPASSPHPVWVPRPARAEPTCFPKLHRKTARLQWPWRLQLLSASQVRAQVS